MTVLSESQGWNCCRGWVGDELDQRFSNFCSRDGFTLFLKKIIYFWLCWVFVATGLSVVLASGGYSSLQCAGFSLQWFLLLGARALGERASVVVALGLSSCGLRALECRLSSCGTRAQLLWHTGLVAPRHVGSSPTRDQTRVPCIGRQTLNHCATREVWLYIF